MEINWSAIHTGQIIGLVIVCIYLLLKLNKLEKRIEEVNKDIGLRTSSIKFMGSALKVDINKNKKK
jgi:uncharacterized protein YoxC